ncbi:hypothetical protein CBS101457_003368 [Exobasidium rhododendri]|nr:hypothetical protein CBS101457_003368 [Exobasidium rhododendri]
MSADAYVSAARLRPPANLSSSTFPNRRNGPHRQLYSTAASSAYRGWRGEDREGDPALTGAQLDSDSYNPPADGVGGNGELQDLPDWIDMDRYEDWERPTLESLCPLIRILYEDDLFPVAVAEDGESLPSEIHPSHPYGNLHHHPLPYNSRSKLPPRRGIRFDATTEISGRNSQADAMDVPTHLATRARQSVSPCTPIWPFKRFGPGPGGPNVLERAENNRYWRPYKAVWADLGLEELLPSGAKVKHNAVLRDLDGDRADLPQAGESMLSDATVEAILQEMEDFEAEDEEVELQQEKSKRTRRMQHEWKWGQPRSEG